MDRKFWILLGVVALLSPDVLGHPATTEHPDSNVMMVEVRAGDVVVVDSDNKVHIIRTLESSRKQPMRIGHQTDSAGVESVVDHGWSAHDEAIQLQPTITMAF